MAGLDKSKVFFPPFAAASGRTALRRLVLIVEDHEDTRELYKYVLELHGYEVVETDKGEDAIRLAEALHPDLVLMDTNLPEMDGLAAVQLIRQHASLQDLPIIFISGHAQPELRAAALAAGGDDYLVKPTSLSDLEASVDKLLANGRNKEPAAEARNRVGKRPTGVQANRRTGEEDGKRLERLYG